MAAVTAGAVWCGTRNRCLGRTSCNNNCNDRIMCSGRQDRAEIQFRQDPVDPQLILQFRQPCRDRIGRADHHLFPHRRFISQRLHVGELRAAPRVRRSFQLRHQLLVPRHDAVMRLRLSLGVGFRDMQRQAQMHLALALVAGRRIRLAIGVQIGRQPAQRSRCARRRTADSPERRAPGTCPRRRRRCGSAGAASETAAARRGPRRSCGTCRETKKSCCVQASFSTSSVSKNRSRLSEYGTP